MAIINKGGNFSNVNILQLDNDGNMLACPTCGSTHLIKRGKDKNTVGEPQRYQCRDCKKKQTRQAKLKTLK